MKNGYLPEEAIVGCVLVDSEYSLPKLEGILNPEHFSDYVFGQVYEIALRLKKDGFPVDAVTVYAKVNSHFIPRLVSICDEFPGSANVEYYRDLVIRNYHERKLKEHMAKGVKSPADESIISGITAEWSALQGLGVKKLDLTEKLLAYSEILEKRGKGKETLYPTGFPRLDYQVPLLKRGELCVVGARTSVGKTALCLSMALKMADAGLRVVYCSGEMSFYQMLDRIISQKADVPLLKIRKGDLNGEWFKITSALGDIAKKKNMRFVEASSLTFKKIMPEVIEFQPDVLFVDFIQRFTPQGKVDTRAAFYSDVANTLKGLCIEKNFVVIAASQLGRGAEQRKGEPILSDLKESGGLEEAADVAWFLHSKEAETLNLDMIDYKMMILKNRNGPTFSFDAVFDSRKALFHEVES